MDEVTMLQVLNAYGEDAGSDFNDGEEVMGYFGWSIDDDRVLTVTYRGEDDPADTAFVGRWRLVPNEDYCEIPL